MRRNLRLSLPTALAIALASTPVAAHIDPAPVLLQKAAEARARLDYETLIVEGVLVAPGAAPIEVWEGIWSSRAHRRELQRPGGAETILTIEQRRWRFGAEGPKEPTRIRPDPWQVFFVDAGGDPGGRRGMALLTAYGIDPETLSMARQDGRPCYVIGAKPWEPNRPQLWLDRVFMTPARLVFSVEGVRHELRWRAPDDPRTTPFYPGRYEERIDGELQFRIEYVRVRPNAPIDERRFQSPGL